MPIHYGSPPFELPFDPYTAYILDDVELAGLKMMDKGLSDYFFICFSYQSLRPR